MSHSDSVNRISVGVGRVASAGGKQVCVWNESGALEWQADADKHAVTEASTIAIVDLASGTELGTWKGSVRATVLGFLGGALLIGKGDGGVEKLPV